VLDEERDYLIGGKGMRLSRWHLDAALLVLVAQCATTALAGEGDLKDKSNATSDAPLAKSYLAVPDATVWPNLTRLPDRTILLAGFDKPSHGQVEGDVGCWASIDEGLTWTPRGTVTKHELQTNRMNQAVGLDRHGNPVALVSGWTDVQQPGAPKKKAFRDAILPTWICRSKDGGKTWRQAQGFPYADPNGCWLVPFGDIVLSEDGRLNAAVYSVPGYPNPDPWGACFFVSEDDGATWHLRSRIAPDLNEAALLYLGDGEWLTAVRGKGKGVSLLRSTDDGMTWENEGEVSKPNQHPAHLLELRDGRILLSYGDRRPGRFGVGARISSNRGMSWGEAVHLASMPEWDGGYPASMEREDGRILTVFYAKAEDTYSVQAVIWDVP
jgi:hypothetical protein